MCVFFNRKKASLANIGLYRRNLKITHSFLFRLLFFYPLVFSFLEREVWKWLSCQNAYRRTHKISNPAGRNWSAFWRCAGWEVERRWTKRASSGRAYSKSRSRLRETDVHGATKSVGENWFDSCPRGKHGRFLLPFLIIFCGGPSLRRKA